MKYSIFCSFLLFFTISCNKKEDTQLPSIQFLSPQSNATFNVFESIDISVKVTDNENLDWVKFDVINELNQTIVPQKEKSADSNSEIIDITLPINDIHISSGNYFVRVSASDGINTKRSFLEVTIIAHPKELKNTFVISEQNPNFLDSLNAINTSNSFLNAYGEIHFIASNSYHHEVLIGANNPPQLFYINENSLSETQNINITNDFNSTFYHSFYIDPIDHNYYLSTFEKQIIVFGNNGIQKRIIPTDSEYRPYQIVTTDTYLIVEEKSINLSSSILNVYFKNTGALFQSHFLDFNITNMEMINENEIIIFGNNQNEGNIVKFFINENVIVTISDNLEINQIVTSCKISNNSFAFSTSENTYRISPTNTNIEVTNMWNISSKKLEFEILSSRIFGINDSFIFALNSDNSVTELTNGNYKNLSLFYNK